MPTEQEYIAKIKQLENELVKIKKQKRYGLVWEDKKEDVVEQCKNELPVLVVDESKTIFEDPNGPTHILIEWDNFHALSVLAYTHEKKVDVIYIDPPYNTGNKDFIYNDSFVDKEDTFRHSKWLSFMEKRLELANKLLKNTGIILMNIDENEFAQLKLLWDEIFWHQNYVIDLIWNSRKSVSNDAIISLNHNHTLIFCKDIKKLQDNKDMFRFKVDHSIFSNPDNDLRGLWTADPFDAPNIRINLTYPITNPNTGTVYYPPNGRCWRTTKEEYKSLYDEWKIIFGKRWISKPQLKRYLSDAQEKWTTPKSIFDDVWTTTNGTQELEKILWENKFTNPKPVSFIRKLLELSSSNDSIILDFFAGSGTTGHAVLELNKEDGGNRQFILCTNNENQIAEEVTYPRIRNVINGYADVEGILANLRYYRTDFISNDKSIDDLRHKFILRCSEMLQVRENCFERASFEWITSHFQVFEWLSSVLVILYDPYDDIDKLAQLAQTVLKRLVVYVFSMSTEIWEEEISHIAPNITIETIPDEILETYKKIFGF